MIDLSSFSMVDIMLIAMKWKRKTVNVCVCVYVREREKQVVSIYMCVREKASMREEKYWEVNYS